MNKIFDVVNETVLKKIVSSAQKRIVISAPGIVRSVAYVIVNASKRLGVENITVVVDPDTEVCRIWYGQIESLELLEAAGIPIRRCNGLRIGFVCADETAFVYSPTPLSIESERKNAASPNAVRIDPDEIEKYLAAIIQPKEIPSPSQEIGIAEVKKEEITLAKNDLAVRPPVKPDLARQVRVVSSEFQFVELKFIGGRIEQRVLPLSAKDLGVKNKRLSQKIKGQYKILNIKEIKGLAEINTKIENIRKRYLKSITGYGSIIDYREKEAFKKAVEKVIAEIGTFKNKVEKELETELETSEKDLLPLIMRNLKRLNQEDRSEMLFPDEYTEENLKAFVQRYLHQKIPSAKELLQGMECTFEFRMIAPEHLEDEKFKKAIENVLGKPLQELAGESLAVEATATT